MEDTGSVLWDWPKPDEKFEDNPHQLGRVMSEEELQAVIKREDAFLLEDKYVCLWFCLFVLIVFLFVFGFVLIVFV